MYGISETEVAPVLRDFAGLAGLLVEAPAVLGEALTNPEKGMDFADALHLAAATNCEALLTFDRKFVDSARESHV